MESSISVIVRTYNSTQHLSGTISSIRMQAWPDLEIIVVDDGSSDNTAEVLEHLRGNDLLILQQKNQGPSATRNLGIGSAQGKWIAFLDADDYRLPLKLKA
jgi:glycosyltransferase involved in cell wall biosynthesis